MINGITLCAGTPLTLSLSSCLDSEFTCSEGSCVALSNRCDMQLDCPDESDEKDCQKLLRNKVLSTYHFWAPLFHGESVTLCHMVP